MKEIGATLHKYMGAITLLKKTSLVFPANRGSFMCVPSCHVFIELYGFNSRVPSIASVSAIQNIPNLQTLQTF